MQTPSPELYWLPQRPDWAAALSAVEPGPEAWPVLCSLARARIGGAQTLRLDRARQRLFREPPPKLATRPVRLAVLASATVEHLLPGIRVGGMRRDIWIETYVPAYGQYKQEVLDPNSALHAFHPDAVLFAPDAHHLVSAVEPEDSATAVDLRIEQICADLAACWDQLRRQHRCQVIQQLPLPVFTPLLGNNEHRLAASPAWVLQRLNMELRARAGAEGVGILAADAFVTAHGLTAWHDAALWHLAKQEVHPAAAPFYGDIVGRLLAASQGRSAKCLVLDLDNTLWGGVIGDDGLAGIKLGQGSALGEAFLAFQRYVRDLGRRGVILAVCSKNDEANALEPFDHHPEMALKQSDIACFIANWNDKAANIREIAARLNIGLDSIVFVDDNPFERTMVARELPMVAVPELPEDPTRFPACLADAGYFEALSLTREDLDRTRQYRENSLRGALLAQATDIAGYLRGLRMEARWGRFDKVGRTRITQLINKTNQFNLTTRRVAEEEIGALIDDETALTLQIRLLDQFGDNGIIAIVIGLFEPGTRDIRIDSWLMSCRVLGRQVEEATLNLVVHEARRLSAERLIGVYRPTGKNEMVRGHYARLGFASMGTTEAGTTRWALDLAEWTPRDTAVALAPSTDERAA